MTFLPRGKCFLFTSKSGFFAAALVLFAAMTCVGQSATQTPSGQTGSSQGGSGASAEKADKPAKTSDSTTTKIRVIVTDEMDKPIANASVYVRFYQDGGFLKKDKLVELDLKSNQDGSVKVPEIPQGKVMVQVIAKGWHTFGEWFDVNKEEQTIPVKLKQPPHWY